MHNQSSRLALAGIHHRQLMAHLFPGDGLEAAAVLLCGQARPGRPLLCVRDIVLVPHATCKRRRDVITWPSDLLEEALERANDEKLSIILVHSHPGENREFSTIDNDSDREIVPDLYDGLAHAIQLVGTAIMLSDGWIKSRIYDYECNAIDIDIVRMAGDDIAFYTPGGSAQRPLAFGDTMRDELGSLTAGFVGASGTGSIVGEQIARLGFGRIVTIDPDHIETKNLNRILNATTEDAISSRLKTDRYADSVRSHRGNVEIVCHPISVESRPAIEALAVADVIFCCVDSAIGRQYCDLIASAFVIPLFDVGVTIPTANEGDGIMIADVNGRIDYVQPGGSALGDRNVYTQAQLRAERLASTDPEGFAQELDDGYIEGAHEEAPSVITLNMRAASAAVSEFIARAYPYRFESNRLYARTEFSLAEMLEEYTSEDEWGPRIASHLVGRGAWEPLLGIPGLSTTNRGRTS